MDHTHHDGNWGHCQGCQYWQSDNQAVADPAAIGICLQDELVHVNLQVTGESGCGKFQPAEVGAGAPALQKGAGI